MMNRGNIPGYYFDEEKKKYFKIQPNHVAPQGAKYTKSNVKREHHVAKKQRVAQRQQNVRRRQTVQRSAVLNAPTTGGIGLLREMGVSSTNEMVSTRDTMFVSQLNSSSTTVHGPPSNNGTTVFRYCPLPEIDHMLLSCSHTPRISFLHMVKWDFDNDPRCVAADEGSSSIFRVNLGDRPMSLTTFRHSSLHRTGIVATSLNADCFIASLLDTESPEIDSCMFLNLDSNRDATLWDCAISGNQQRAAVGLSNKVIQVDLLTAHIISQLSVKHDAYSLDYLSEATLAFTSDKTVRLWDTRAQGTSSRFRHQARVTGIRAENEHQLLISSNKLLSLYDVRMAKRAGNHHDDPVVSMPILHEGPQLIFDSNKAGLVAAATIDGIGVYSLRTGGVVKSLQLPSNKMLVTQVSWHEDRKGVPMLRAAQGDRVLKWSWSCNRDNDEG